MSNMSYCRFENTLRDFRECVQSVHGLFDAEEHALSREETVAAARLIAEAFELVARTVEEAQLGTFDELMDDPHLQRKLTELIEKANRNTEAAHQNGLKGE